MNVTASLLTDRPTPLPENETASVPTAGARHEPPVLAPAGAPIRTKKTVTFPAVADIVEEWGKQSFPASDPPANW